MLAIERETIEKLAKLKEKEVKTEEVKAPVIEPVKVNKKKKKRNK